MRDRIRDEVAGIVPFDPQERRTREDVLQWIDSGVELCRRQKPATPPRHLVSYFVVIDGEHLLLVDHINAELWLPSGGHVEPGEHPQATVLREAKEELGIDAELLQERPFFLTSTRTRALTAGHVDVSLWYLVRGDRTRELVYDEAEFRGIHWFHRDRIPLERSDPEMGRFLGKLAHRGPG